MKINKLLIKKALFLIAGLCLCNFAALARFGGGGGHGGHGGGGHSSGGGGYSGGYGGGGLSPSAIVVILIIVGIIYLIRMIRGKSTSQAEADAFFDRQEDDEDNSVETDIPSMSFPEGLTQEKIITSFMELQKAWQAQDLSKVRKWMSDGMYQRLTAQFAMMKQLTQRNYLSNIQIYNIAVVDITDDGNYETADVAISFSMNDEFLCEKYPALNESYIGDSDTEYWTFIKRTDAKAHNADLYNTTNCPNCGASLENNLGEVSRCSSCGTLTNNAAYDWVLSEITQGDDYDENNKSDLIEDDDLQELVKNDPLFSIQRMEDIASNVFMQIMEVMTENNSKKLSRFATPAVANEILQIKASMSSFVFDRLYLNDVTLAEYDTNDNKLNLLFNLSASYQRIQIGNRLQKLDDEIAVHQFEIVLSKDIDALKKPIKEIAFSYECANCGAPYNDTTNDTCTYCDAPVVDTSKNWVLTRFNAY